jgi:hypothetical protein
LYRTYAVPSIGALSRATLRARGRVERLLPPRRRPKFARQQRNIRSYPKGYNVAELGTFPDQCPVPRD